MRKVEQSPINTHLRMASTSLKIILEQFNESATDIFETDLWLVSYNVAQRLFSETDDDGLLDVISSNGLEDIFLITY